MERRRTAFGDWLQGRREEHDLTQSQLSELLGTAKRSTISHWENYGEIPGTDSLLALAAVFGVPPGHLFELAGMVPPNDIPASSLESARPDFVWVPIIKNFDAPRSEGGGYISWVPDQLISSRDQVFAVRVHTDRLEPMVLDGDLMLADRDRPPADGDVIVVKDEAGRPDVWRLAKAGAAWWLCDGTGTRRHVLDRSKVEGVMLTIHRPRHAVRWAEGMPGAHHS